MTKALTIIAGIAMITAFFTMFMVVFTFPFWLWGRQRVAAHRNPRLFAGNPLAWWAMFIPASLILFGVAPLIVYFPHLMLITIAVMVAAYAVAAIAAQSLGAVSGMRRAAKKEAMIAQYTATHNL